MERGINGICSQFCPAAPRGFCRFCRAGRGKACFSRGSPFFRGAGRGGAGRASLVDAAVDALVGKLSVREKVLMVWQQGVEIKMKNREAPCCKTDGRRAAR